MSDIDRWTVEDEEGVILAGGVGSYHDDFGEWVDYDDHCKHIAELEAKVAEQDDFLADQHHGCNKRRLELEAKVAAAEKDVARLDWLEGEKGREQGPFDEDCERSLFRRNMPITREAIDAARESGDE